jgi:hypothetical protein
VGASTISVWNSCPTLTRSGRALNLQCVGGDAGALGTCAAGTCQTNADCLGQRPIDEQNTNAACEGTDCVCYQNACYFGCTTELDCPGGYSCDPTNKVCKQTGCVPGQPADQTCKVQKADARAVCRPTSTSPGDCVIPCAGDHDCSQFSGAIPGTSFAPQSVCGPDSFCVSVGGGCTVDDDCRTISNTTNGFCVAASPPSFVRSAIANH